MRKCLIVPIIVLLPLVVAGAETAQERDREALRDAWIRYTELIEKEDDEAALVAAQQVFELSEKLFSEDDKQLAAATLNYADVLYYAGRLEDSTDILKIALRRFEHLYGENSPELIHVLLSMADASAGPPDYRPDQHFLDRAQEIASSNFDPLSVDYADAQLRIADSSFFYPPSDATGRAIEAAYEIHMSQPEPAAIKVGRAAYLRGVFFSQRGEYEDAERSLREALDVLDSSDEEQRELSTEVREGLAGLREVLDKRAAENASLAEILELSKSSRESGSYLPLVRVAPIYPASALRERKTGYVDLVFTVDEQGFVINPEVVRYTGHESFQDAALQAVFKFRYVPLIVEGESTAVHGVKTRISFRIRHSN